MSLPFCVAPEKPYQLYAGGSPLIYGSGAHYGDTVEGTFQIYKDDLFATGSYPGANGPSTCTGADPDWTCAVDAYPSYNTQVKHICDLPTSGTGTFTVNCSGSCTVIHEVKFQDPLLSIEPAQGALIAGAILAVWAVGWAARQVIRALSSDGDSSTSESET